VSNLYSLDASWCRSLADSSVAHLHGLHTLALEGCEGLTDAALTHLDSVHSLNIRHTSISDRGLRHVAGLLHSLDVSECENVDGSSFGALYEAGLVDLTTDIHNWEWYS
jgi:hypothetical protein